MENISASADTVGNPTAGKQAAAAAAAPSEPVTPPEVVELVTQGTCAALSAQYFMR